METLCVKVIAITEQPLYEARQNPLDTPRHIYNMRLLVHLHGSSCQHSPFALGKFKSLWDGYIKQCSKSFGQLSS